MTLGIIVLFLILILAGTVIFVNTSPQFGAKAGVGYHERIRNCKNFTNGKFKNIERTAILTKFNLFDIAKIFIKGNTTPDFTIPVDKCDSIEQKNELDLKATWIGHSSILVELNNKKIFLDPMLGTVPAPLPWLGTKRFNDELPIDIENITQIDAVLFSHDHYDHLDYWTINKIKDKVERFYVPLGLASHLLSWGVGESKIIELEWWEKASFEELTFICTPSRHFSGRGLFNRCSTLWCSWVIKNEKINIFFSGDGGYGNTFKEIGDKLGPFDLTFLECGQYSKCWSETHMMPEETVQAHMDLKGELLMPIHWGAFKLSIHPWQEPIERLLKTAKSLNVKVTTPKIGEPVILNKSIPCSKWWSNKP